MKIKLHEIFVRDIAAGYKDNAENGVVGYGGKLNIRAFSPEMARAAYELQKGICAKCGGHFEIEEMHADHITPWSKGGKTNPGNCQMLCADCNRRKSDV